MDIGICWCSKLQYLYWRRKSGVVSYRLFRPLKLWFAFDLLHSVFYVSMAELSGLTGLPCVTFMSLEKRKWVSCVEILATTSCSTFASTWLRWSAGDGKLSFTWLAMWLTPFGFSQEFVWIFSSFVIWKWLLFPFFLNHAGGKLGFLCFQPSPEENMDGMAALPLVLQKMSQNISTMLSHLELESVQ